MRKVAELDLEKDIDMPLLVDVSLSISLIASPPRAYHATCMPSSTDWVGQGEDIADTR